MEHDHFSAALQWRYATKRMNGTPVPDSKAEAILEAIRMAPSSMGLQPYRVLVISDPDLRKRIHEKACTQPQVIEGSHLLVFATLNHIDEDLAREFVGRVTAERDLSDPKAKSFLKMIVDGISGMDPVERQNWAARQAYLGLGFGLSAAALQGVDATPMEGFEPAEMDLVLDLHSKGLHSVVLMALGYRDLNHDQLVGKKKVRLPANQFLLRQY